MGRDTEGWAREDSPVCVWEGGFCSENVQLDGRERPPANEPLWGSTCQRWATRFPPVITYFPTYSAMTSCPPGGVMGKASGPWLAASVSHNWFQKPQ